MIQRITAPFKNIGLMGRPGKASVVTTLKLVHEYLTAHGLNSIFDDATVKWVGLDGVQSVSSSLLGEACDLVIVVGGDGSLLNAARALVHYTTPVVGINRGRLGFLADVSPDEVLLKLEQVFRGEYTLDKRFLLQLEVRDGADIRHEAIALNDIVLHAGKSVHMIDFELEIDGHPVYRQHSDGLIVATPTGSTAYSLSAGGPILHPSQDAIVIVPLSPHTLSSRPIVIGGESEIKVKIRNNRVEPMVSADGQPSFKMSEDDVLYVRKHPFKLTLLHPPGYGFYAACRTKLGWNQDFENHTDEDDLFFNVGTAQSAL